MATKKDSPKRLAFLAKIKAMTIKGKPRAVGIKAGKTIKGQI